MRNKLYTCNEIVICRLKTEIIGGILYVIQTTTQCVCLTVLADKFGIRCQKIKELLNTDLLGCLCSIITLPSV